jgi:hypothetical protein
MTPTRLFALLLLLFFTPAWAEPQAVLFDVQMAVRLGERRMVVQPQLKVASEQSADLVLAEDGEARMELSITPKVEGGLIRLAVKVLAVDGARRLQRTLQYTALPGEPAQFSDEDSEESLKLSITPTLVD